MSHDVVLGYGWLTLSLCSALVKAFPVLQFVSKHGKTKAVKGPEIHSARKGRDAVIDPLLIYLSGMCVPKSYFRHMYLIGVVVTIFIMKRHCSGISLQLFLVHVMRRLLECYFVTEYGSAEVHIFGYGVGVVHYLMVPVTLTLVCQSTSAVNNFRAAFQVIVVILFLVCNICQFYFHYRLFQWKKEKSVPVKSAQGGYAFPHGFGFDTVCCPHYTAECGLYLCLWTLQSYSISSTCMCMWVIVNLMTVSEEHWRWYSENFPEQTMKNRRRGWSRMIPGLY